MSVNTIAGNMLDDARIVAKWSMLDVVGYLAAHSAEFLDYPPGADANMVRICDDENRARAVVYRSGCACTGRTLDAAGRALEFVGRHAG
jgi:hypothetical protein